MSDAGQHETKTQNAANCKTAGSLNKGASLTQVRESFLGSSENAILAEPDFGVKRGSGMCLFFIHVGLTGFVAHPSSP